VLRARYRAVQCSLIRHLRQVLRDNDILDDGLATPGDINAYTFALCAGHALHNHSSGVAQDSLLRGQATGGCCNLHGSLISNAHHLLMHAAKLSINCFTSLITCVKTIPGGGQGDRLSRNAGISIMAAFWGSPAMMISLVGFE